jgi:protein-tyrosine phosphatase
VTRGNDWLEDEVANWKREGFDVIVSLLTENEVNELALSEEAELCQSLAIVFYSLPVIDRQTPDNLREFSEIAQSLANKLRDGISIGIHCRQGIGRSGLLAVAVLVTLGNDLEASIRIVSEARGRPIPETAEQRAWLLTHLG